MQKRHDESMKSKEERNTIRYKDVSEFINGMNERVEIIIKINYQNQKK